MPISDLEQAFDQWLRERREGLTTRQEFWLAWKAGAEWALDGIRKGAGQDGETAVKRLMIFAGNYNQALQHAAENGIPPNQFVYAADRWRVAGLDAQQFEVAFAGTWKQNEEVVEAYQYWTTRPGFSKQHSEKL